MNQLSMRMTDFLADELGCEFFEVTAHAGARPSHRVWQGEVYHRGGEKDGYPDLEETTGLGRVDGLCGANCRHGYHPFFPGISERTYSRKQLREIDPPSFTYNGKVYNTYEATQKQRDMETAIRKTKRELLGYDSAGLKDDYAAAAVKLKRQRDAYKEFSYHADMAQQKELTQIYGFGHSQASKAVWVEKVAKSYGDFKGITLPNGIKITGASDHFGLRAMSRNVSKEDIENALTKPLQISKMKIDTKGRESFCLIGEKATVSVNPDGTLITVYPTSTKRAKRLKGDTS